MYTYVANKCDGFRHSEREDINMLSKIIIALAVVVIIAAVIIVVMSLMITSSLAEYYVADINRKGEEKSNEKYI